MKLRTAKKILKKSWEHVFRKWDPNIILLIYAKRWKDVRKYTFYTRFLQAKSEDRLRKFYKNKKHD